MKRGKPLQRKTRLTAKSASPKARAPLKAKRSTTTPTKAERAHIEQIKQPGRCVCCAVNPMAGRYRADYEGCDAHHVLAGGKRRGHLATLGLCPWHHRGVRPPRYPSDASATLALGPSLAHGSRPFCEVYGSEGYLLDLQRELMPV